jgi:hypothetical protein
VASARSNLENYNEVLAQAKRGDVQGLREHLRTAVVDHGVFVHGLAARKLAHLRSVESAPDIVPLLEDSAWQVRTDAARALSILAHTGIADELTRRLDEPDDGVLCFIILALGRTRDPASVPALARPGRNGTRTGNAGARGIFALALPGDNGASASCSAARPKAMSSDALPVFSTEPDAWAEASRRNRRLGQERVADRYWLATAALR